jgi:hypothetical protein
MPAMPKPSAVLFVDHVPEMAAFYRELVAMTVIHEAPDHVVLEIEGMQLVIHSLPEKPEGNLTNSQPVQVREDSYLKLCFPVANIAFARARALALGGYVGPGESEWQARDFRACDGHDPEGNVIQVRENACAEAVP